MTFGLLLLVALLGIGVAGFACTLSWRGKWKTAAIILGAPLLLAGLAAVLALSGALASGQSEDWGPLLALLIVAPIAAFSIVAGLAAAIFGYFGQRSRTNKIVHRF